MKRLLTPRWVVAHIVVLMVVIVCVNLGFWQLRRLDERRIENTVGETRFNSVPEDLEVLMSSVGADLDSLVYRRALTTGVFDPDNEVLIRSQIYLENAGFHVITPLVLADGTAVLVNRGWVPLVLDRVPVNQAPPPVGEVEVLAWLDLTKIRGAFGPADLEEGRLVAMSRVDIDRIQQQVPYRLAPMYLLLLDALETDLPISPKAPVFDDEGPHLGYAIQWFGFALVGLIGYGFLIRKALAALPSPQPTRSDQGTRTPAGRA